MPIPRGAHQVAGNPNRVQLSSGEIVTRSTARTLGAREMGYKSNYEYGKHAAGDTKYFNAWVKTEQGKKAVRIARERARAEGRDYRRTDLKSELIAARNARPHSSGRIPGTPGKPAGQAWLNFYAAYDMDSDDYFDY